MKKIIVLITFLFLSASCSRTYTSTTPYTNPLQVGSQKIYVHIVSTNQEMQQGLAGQEKLRNDQGMLFDFSHSENKRPTFWMKDMKFDLDILWVKDNKIIGIEKFAPAPKDLNTPLPTYSPPGEIDSVLEVNAGWADTNNISVGNVIQ